MKFRFAWAVAAIACLCAPATAQQPVMPQSEFEMRTVLTDPDSGRQFDMEVRHRGGIFRMQGEFEGQDAIALLDHEREVTTILINMHGMRMAMEMPHGEGIDLPLPEEEALIEIIGNDVVAGEPCTVYRVEDDDVPGGEAHGCLTDDSIVLRVEVPGRGTLMEATHFARTPQDASLFTIPPGYQVMQMPSGMGFPR